MNTSQNTRLLYFLLGLILLVDVTFSSRIETNNKDGLQEHTKASNKLYDPQWMSPDYVATYVDNIAKNMTGFRGAIQWTLGENTLNNSGIYNSMVIKLDSTLVPNNTVYGEIGIYSNGSTFDIFFHIPQAVNSIAGPSFKCGVEIIFFDDHLCFKSNFNLVNNAIYYFDVEIRDKSVRGYISEPQKDLNDMNDPYLPRHLIADIKVNNVLKNIEPYSYLNMNYAQDFLSCDLVKEMVTVNYAPQIYNKTMRQTTYFRSFTRSIYCEPQNTLISFFADMKTAIYLSRPSVKINELRLSQNK